MKTILRSSLALAILCLIGSVAGLIAGVGKVEEPLTLRFDPDPFVVPIASDWPGERDFKVDVINTSDDPARIVGAEDFCGAACFSGIELPATIPANGRGQVIVRVKTNTPGPISETLNFYTDCPSQPRLSMRIEGNIPEGANRATSTDSIDP